VPNERDVAALAAATAAARRPGVTSSTALLRAVANRGLQLHETPGPGGK
jgi:hypothetical protein